MIVQLGMLSPLSLLSLPLLLLLQSIVFQAMYASSETEALKKKRKRVLKHQTKKEKPHSSPS